MDKSRPAEQQIHRLRIDGYASDGSGVARLDGMVVFVQGGIRGELCDVRLTHVGRSALWGRVVEVVNPSPAREFPQCLHYTKCGGCQFRHMNYAEELEAKRIRVEDALRRLGGADIRVPDILGARNICRYRNKAQFPVSRGPRIGFYRPRSHSVIDVEDCLLQSEAASRLRMAVKDWMERWGVPAYDERSFTGLIRHVYVRTNRLGQSLCCLLVNGGGVPRETELVSALRQAEPGLVGVVLGVNRSRTNVILGDDSKVYVLDWAHAAIGNASADAAMTYLLFALEDQKKADLYLKLFCLSNDIAIQYVQKWLPIVAAAQMTKQHGAEREFLTNWTQVVEFE